MHKFNTEASVGASLPDFRAAIAATLGNSPDIIEPGELMRFATNGKRGDQAGWCILFDDLRGGVFGCHRQGITETWRARLPSPMTVSERVAFSRRVLEAKSARAREQRLRWAKAAQSNATTWAACHRLTPGDVATHYLERRGFGGAWPLPTCLRFHPALDYWHEGAAIGKYPALVAPLTGQDRRIVALHRTHLALDGHKADVPIVRKVTAASGPLSGACIELHEPYRGCIGVAEGIETALGAWLATDVPTIAAYSAASLRSYQWPSAVQKLIVFADADLAGREAADVLRARAIAARLRVEVVAPSNDGADWADVWAMRSGVEA